MHACNMCMCVYSTPKPKIMYQNSCLCLQYSLQHNGVAIIFILMYCRVGCCIRFIDVRLLITLWMLNVFPWKTTTTPYTTCPDIIRTTAYKQTTTTTRQQNMATYVYMLPYIFADAERLLL